MHYDLDHLTDYAVAYYERIREKYGKGRERRTELRSFDTIEAAKVAVTNAKLYVDRAEGFFGIGKSMKDAEFVCDCSDIDDVIVFTKDGRYIITKVSDKAFFDKNIYYIGVFKRNDERTIYNVLYHTRSRVERPDPDEALRDQGHHARQGVRHHEGNAPKRNPLHDGQPQRRGRGAESLLQAAPAVEEGDRRSRLLDAGHQGASEPGQPFFALRHPQDRDEGARHVDARQPGNLVRRRRAPAQHRRAGLCAGAFKGEDKLLVWTPRTYYITGYDLQQHFPDDTVLVERYRPERVYAVCYFDREQNYYYLKRFPIESSDKTQFFLDEEGTGDFVCRTGRAGAQLEVTYAGAQASRPAERIEVDGFVGVKSHRAKGKRVTTFEVASLHFVEPEEPEEEPADPATGDDRSGDAPAGGPAVATGAAAANEVGAASGIELPEEPAAVPPQTDDVEFTIERPRGDQDDVIDVEQLNLF